MPTIDDEFMFVNLDKAVGDFGDYSGMWTDRAIFTCIAEHTTPQGVCSVSQNTIAEETGYARRTVSNSIHRLADKDFFTIEKILTDNRGIASNIYHINPKYLHTKTAKRASNHCSACMTPCGSTMNDTRRLSHDLTRLHDVLVDVVADILVAAATKESMK